MKHVALVVLLLPLVAHARSPSWSDVWPHYRIQQSASALDYTRGPTTSFNGGTRTTFALYSQRWPHADSPLLRHRVELLVPEHARPGPALLVINNGTLNVSAGRMPQVPDDYPGELLEALAREQGMAIVMLGDVPPQSHQLPGDTVARGEDDLVAATWRRFLDAPARFKRWPLHLPMAEAAVRAMDLADHELAGELRPSYIVTGASKRAWAGWLLPLVDHRVSHLVPFVMGMHWESLAPHIQRSYGGRWPIAFQPYLDHDVTTGIGSDAFHQLMQVSDPWYHLQGAHRERLSIPKYLIDASGDDFFTPDATAHYLADLPGDVALRVAPNSDHGGIRRFMASSLSPVLSRWRAGQSLPKVDVRWDATTARLLVRILGQERPQEARVWQAHNPTDRDFRYACGIRYTSQPLALGTGGALAVRLPDPLEGWSASFVELEFQDGLVVTSPVHVGPETRFPLSPPAEGSGACRLARPAPSSISETALDVGAAEAWFRPTAQARPSPASR